MVLPDRIFSWRILGRATIAWIGVRAALLWLGGLIFVEVSTAIAAAAVAAALAMLETRRRNEHLFLANLAVPTRALVLLASVPPAVLELAMRFVAPA